MSNEVRIEVSEKFLETLGDATLLGTIAKHNIAMNKVDKVVLVFPQTSNHWRQKNGGPAAHVINEYVIHCLMTDVFELQSFGIEVVLETIVKDPRATE